MIRTRTAIGLSGLLLVGCSNELPDLGRAAEGVRVRTERMVDSSEAASNSRQEKIFAEAAELGRAEESRNHGPRFEARKDGAGDNWIIYDNRTGNPARIGSDVMTGLSLEEARAKLSHMEDEDDLVFRR